MAADGYLETIPSSEHVAVTHGLFRHHGCEGIPLGLMTDESELIGHSLSGKKNIFSGWSLHYCFRTLNSS